MTPPLRLVFTVVILDLVAAELSAVAFWVFLSAASLTVALAALALSTSSRERPGSSISTGSGVKIS